jgi:hypothetical protein
MSNNAFRCGTCLAITGPSGVCSAPSEIEETARLGLSKLRCLAPKQCPPHQLRQLLRLNAPSVQGGIYPDPGVASIHRSL